MNNQSVYSYIIKIKPELKIEDVLEKVNNKYKLSCVIPYNYPIKESFCLDEELNDLELHEYRKYADSIFKSFYNYVLNNVSQNERDMIGIYDVYTNKASFAYDIDEHRKTSLYKVMDEENKIYVDTILGKIPFEFASREKYNQSEDTIFGYEDELQIVVIFVNDPNNISRKELIDILANRSGFDHELEHHIDKIKNTWSTDTYDMKDNIAYLNNPNEFKANLQMILTSFGRYLFKNYNKIDLNNLKTKEKVNKLFDMFLCDEVRNVVSPKTLRLFRVAIEYLNKENKEEFYKQLYKYTADYYAKEHDLSESSITLKDLISIFRLGDNFIGL